MAKLRRASSSTFILFFILFLSPSSALASTSDIPEAITGVAPRDTSSYDDLIVLPSYNSEQTILPNSESEASSAVPVIADQIPVDLTEVKEDRDDFPASVPLKEIPPFHHHHHHHHHRPGRLGRKEISYGNDMILSSSHGIFGNSGFEEDEGFDGEDGGLRKFHHHHDHHDRHRHRFDEGEVEGMDDKREGHPLGPWFHQRRFGGEEEHPPFHHGFHRRRHPHHHHEEGEEGGLLFKLRKFLNGF